MKSVPLKSPWLEQLATQRPARRLRTNLTTDIAVVGAGIAGVTTAYFLLRHAGKRVALIEADRVAHGATGHNAGQLVSYFERPFSDIVHEFGLGMAAEGQKAIESSWELLDYIRHDLDLDTPYSFFKGYAGFVDVAELLIHLKNNSYRLQANLSAETVYIDESSSLTQHIPKYYQQLCTPVSQDTILDFLQTKDRRYFAAMASKKGVMNSAGFCEEIVNKLLKLYPRRFTLAEHTPVNTVDLYHTHAQLKTGPSCIIRAKRVVLCTNGFEHLNINNHTGTDIDTKFHHLVRGAVGYMAAFEERPQMAPMAASYLPAQVRQAGGSYDADPYFYLTRRPYGEDGTTSLVCVGGPEALMDNTNEYSKQHPYSHEAKSLIDAFVRRTYRHTGRRLKYTHLWHGLMGYTPNGIRCVGTEPCNRVLLYNLGCNGVGILPSIYGSLRISQIIKGRALKPSIFDPADKRCRFISQKHPQVFAPSPRWIPSYAMVGLILLWMLFSVIAVTISWLHIT